MPLPAMGKVLTPGFISHAGIIGEPGHVTTGACLRRWAGGKRWLSRTFLSMRLASGGGFFDVVVILRQLYTNLFLSTCPSVVCLFFSLCLSEPSSIAIPGMRLAQEELLLIHPLTNEASIAVSPSALARFINIGCAREFQSVEI